MKSPITASSENVPDSQSSAYRRKCYHLFKQYILSAHVRKNRHYLILFNQMFGKYFIRKRTCSVSARSPARVPVFLQYLSGHKKQQHKTRGYTATVQKVLL